MRILFGKIDKGYKMRKTLLFVLVLIIYNCTFANLSFSKSDFLIYFNPGIKFGWEMGGNEKNIKGIEMSFGILSLFTGMHSGFVFGYQKGPRNIKYVEYQIAHALGGVSVGKEFSTDNPSYYTKLHGGMLVYGNYKIPFNNNPHEWFFVLKLPVPVGIYHNKDYDWIYE